MKNGSEQALLRVRLESWPHFWHTTKTQMLSFVEPGTVEAELSKTFSFFFVALPLWLAELLTLSTPEQILVP